MPKVMKNWLSEPAGPPIEPGRHEVKYVGMTTVFNPTIKPSTNLYKICTVNPKLQAPTTDIKIVIMSMMRKVFRKSKVPIVML